ncbi:MAG: iron complex outermembrane receptor protein [Alteromonadaceae bacterium]|jgi:iron complex outermembrane receptor protein
MSTKFKTTSLAIAVSLALGTAPSYAAEGDAVKEQEVERIAVVGSRAAPRSVADSPVPIDIIGGDELGKNASSDMLDQLQAAIPSLTVKSQPISDASSFIRPINLRGLSSDSTLVLLNGKRRHRASVISFLGGGINDGAQGPDISVIPSVALKQVEVLRDGAAAQYGSDAIAGVINFVLKDDADGGSLSVRRGEFFRGDGEQTIVDGNIGLPFTEDGFVNLSFQYKNAEPSSTGGQRNDAAALIAAGVPGVPDPAMVWGNPDIEDDITLFANVGLDLGNDKEFYMFGNYSDRTATGPYYYRNPQNKGGVYTDGGNLLIADLTDDMSGNCPVIDATQANILTDPLYISGVRDNPDCFSFNEMPGLEGGFRPAFTGEINDTSLTMGTKGEIKGGFLDEAMYDVSASFGRNKSTYTLRNSVNPSNGPNQPVGYRFDAGSYTQLEKSLSASLVKGVDVGLDDPMNVAAGLEWRQDSFEITAGERASWEIGPLQTQGFDTGVNGFPGFSPESQGVNSRSNIGAYIDVEAYLSEDFLVGGALRYEDFSSFGDTLNYKITAQYRINDELALRGSHSTGFRAPTVGQANVINTQTKIVDGELAQSGTFPPTNPLSVYYGGKELTPEESESFAFGAVYQAGDFFFTADFYSIEVTDRITQTSDFTVLSTDYAPLEALGVIAPSQYSGLTFFANNFDTKTQGVDIVSSYRMDLFNGDTKFNLVYNYNSTEIIKAGKFTNELKIKRLEEAIPEHRATFTVTQSWEDVSMFIRANYFSEYFAVHADGADDDSQDDGPSAVTLDAEVSYFMNESLTFSVGANNLLDQEAKKISADNIWSGAIYHETSPFDFNGGYYYVKATYNF